jgi:4-amino-4-deoxy-L-arabinose transferase-like glycosyltransferase
VDGALLLIVCASLYFFALGASGLLDGLDASSAEAAREMVDSGNYLLPQLNFQIDFTRPVLFDWLVSGAYQMFGIGLFAARVWSAVFASLSVLCVYLLGRTLVGRKPALFAAILFACAPAVVIMARLSGPQTVFAGLISASLFAFVQSVFLGRKKWSPVFYAGLALAVLTLGPVALLFFVFSILLYVAVTRPSHVRVDALLRKLQLKRGLLWFGAICAPWFCAAAIASQGQWTSLYFTQSMPKFASLMGETSQPWGTLMIAMAGLLPSVLFLPSALKDGLTGNYGSASVETRQALTFLACFVLAGLVWLPMIEQGHLAALPLLAPMAVLIGATLDKWSHSLSAYRSPAVWRNVCLLLAVAGPSVAVFAAVSLTCTMKNLPALFTTMGLSGLAVLAFGFLFQYSLLRAERVSFGINATLATMLISTALLTPLGFEIGYRMSQQDLAYMAAQVQQRSGQLAIYKSFSPAMMYNLQRPVDCVYDAKRFAVDPMHKQPLLVLAKRADADELTATYPNNVQQLDNKGSWKLLLLSNMRLAGDETQPHVYGIPSGTDSVVPLTAGSAPAKSHYRHWM